MPEIQPTIGIDVAQAVLDVCVHPSGEHRKVAHDSANVDALTRALLPYEPSLVVVEAIGGLELTLAAILTGAEPPVVIVNPRQVRNFAQATGRLAKTDGLDAWTLAEFAAAVNPPVRPLPDNQLRQLQDLVARRQQVITMRTMEKTRLARPSGKVGQYIQVTIAHLNGQVRQVEKDIQDLLLSCPEWRERADLLSSVPGVGPVLYATVIARLPESGELNGRKSRRWPGWLPSIGTAGPCGGNRRCGEGVDSCAASFTWRLCPLFGSTR